ncbi:molybdenum cofactor biosynthesis protein MoaA [Burkholderia sp. Cy-647]|nr:molybdenum cofactor biosynthesis protein MoaA [Burkholderia sp. Tr-860]NIF63079.1 molybdenum cofactor biosynthesis protein MoaA [Burkholderia sp. Cy-647]NIF69427.1 molybdenum cofactor biosynthesis protein MoaA [Burkholderia sp. Ap-962]NIF89466.1 molybdenum cofactor biosynthesis protein MoaA [Burkholderia sp. Cy-637]NIF95806.1 molybdenum cofactor biosynthesis protein MoaA [Burkholderia sp. Ax-1720]
MREQAVFPAWLKQAYELCAHAVPGAMLIETVTVEDALARVTAIDIVAPGDVPAVALASCDGYALRAADTAAATARQPAELRVDSGLRLLLTGDASPASRALQMGRAAEAAAWFPLPEHADTVASHVEHRPAYRNEQPYLVLQYPLPESRNVVTTGSEYRQGEVVVSKGTRLGPRHQLALIAAGLREVNVVKRPRIGVLIVGHDRAMSEAVREPWRRPDATGAYVRAVLRQWGYEVPAVEYLTPPNPIQAPHAVQHDEQLFKQRLSELSKRYDLIIGAGLPGSPPFQTRGLNGQTQYTNARMTIDIKQSPAGRFDLGRSEDRSPSKRWTIPRLRPDGTPGGTQTLTAYDQATLLNFPGHIGAVAIGLHTVAAHVLGLLEHVAMPGPQWETGIVAHSVERDSEFNAMRWGNRDLGADGRSSIKLLPFQGEGQISGVANADVLVAIPAGDKSIESGSPVLFLRLDRTSPDILLHPTMPAIASRKEAPSSTVDSISSAPSLPSADLPLVWRRIEAAIFACPGLLPGGFNEPANDDDIARLQAATQASLPQALLDSLRMHDGQVQPHNALVDSDRLLSARDILVQWSIWRGLADSGDFDGMSSEPEPGIRDDWYNPGWIPFTHDGSGNHLCLDLDPAPGGTFGQVIRIWHDDPEREQVATSYADWLAHVADRVEVHRYRE